MTAPPPPHGTDLDALQSLLDRLPADYDAMDVVMIDGWLCGVLLQPRPIAGARWLPPVIDLDGRPPPPRFDLPRLRALLGRRHGELNGAIERRRWFDPWVFELDAAASPSEAVMPWVAGFATALDVFPALVERWGERLVEPLAAMYRHLDPDDVDDDPTLRETIALLGAPAGLSEAVEDLVRGVLLIADLSRPRPAPAVVPAARRASSR